MTRLQVLAHSILPLCCLLLAAGGPAPQSNAQGNAPAAKATPAELQAQLIAAADEGRRLARSAYSAGQGSVEEGNVWTARWNHARLLAAPDRPSRLAILADGVKAAEDWETQAKAMHAAGVVKPTDVTAARYVRLEAELALASEQAK